jgi:hypothetical protein
LQIAGVTMPAATLAAALRAAPPLRPDVVDEGDHPVEPGSRMEGGKHLLALRLVQPRRLGEQLLEPGRFQRAFPIGGDRDCTTGQLSSSTLIHGQRVRRPPKKNAGL